MDGPTVAACNQMATGPLHRAPAVTLEAGARSRHTAQHVAVASISMRHAQMLRCNGCCWPNTDNTCLCWQAPHAPPSLWGAAPPSLMQPGLHGLQAAHAPLTRHRLCAACMHAAPMAPSHTRNVMHAHSHASTPCMPTTATTTATALATPRMLNTCTSERQSTTFCKATCPLFRWTRARAAHVAAQACGTHGTRNTALNHAQAAGWTGCPDPHALLQAAGASREPDRSTAMEKWLAACAAYVPWLAAAAGDGVRCCGSEPRLCTTRRDRARAATRTRRSGSGIST